MKPIKASELQPLDTFKTGPKKRKEYTVREIETVDETYQAPPSEMGKRIVWTYQTGCKQLLMAPDTELILIHRAEGTTHDLPPNRFLQLAAPEVEWKEKAVMRYGVEHQGRTFRACLGLTYWIRYDDHCFDIRLARQFLGLPANRPELDISASPQTFTRKIKELLEAIGEKDFLDFAAEVAEWLHEHELKGATLDNDPDPEPERAELNDLPF